MIAPMLALAEETRAEGNAARAEEIISTPGHLSYGSLPAYQHSARSAFETAAAMTEQPELGWLG
ncbi:hypothetical protein [Streptomyces sp. NPDC088258]|uniref:hypothetical protein n=1 Tax=Streptomyces sp. NPDC088258 TaxID=3365849 RepID=UPI00382CC7D7